MRQFITLPYLVELSSTQSWSNPTSTGKEYVVRDLDLDPLAIESIRESKNQQFMYLDTKAGKTYMIDCSRQQLLEQLGGDYAPNPTQE